MTDNRWINQTAAEYGKGGDSAVVSMMAVAINAERERCAKIADARAAIFKSGDGACSLSLQEECEDIAAKIRAGRLGPSLN